jgi:hypothetical protein
MIMHSNFWPLDFDQEVELYDNPSWNLPGRRKRRLKSAPNAKPETQSSQSK